MINSICRYGFEECRIENQTENSENSVKYKIKYKIQIKYIALSLINRQFFQNKIYCFKWSMSRKIVVYKTVRFKFLIKLLIIN